MGQFAFLWTFCIVPVLKLLWTCKVQGRRSRKKTVAKSLPFIYVSLGQHQVVESTANLDLSHQTTSGSGSGLAGISPRNTEPGPSSFQDSATMYLHILRFFCFFICLPIFLVAHFMHFVCFVFLFICRPYGLKVWPMLTVIINITDVNL